MTSRLVAPVYPPPNSSPIADAIRERRGARGLSPLDGTLLNVPAFAEGWNTLLGAVRTKGKLGGDVREIMILRVAALNHATFEWIHHEHVARDAGLTTEQLYLVRDTTYTGEGEETDSILSPIQRAALAFAHYSTSTVKVPAKVTLTLAAALSTADPSLLVECASIVSSYNMVSRFLVSLDVAGMSSSTVPWPHTKSTHRIPLPDEDGAYLHAETYVTDDKDGEWVVCSNSLLTNTGMWEWALGGLLAPRPGGGGWLGRYKTYNVLLFDQRGHGKSSSSPGLKCTIPILASDIAFLISSIIMPSGSSIRASTESVPPVHAVIGVSQGGASALAFAAMYPGLAKAVVACDTGPRTPEGNKQAWEERIQLANSDGMKKLAEVTLPRWFHSLSNCSMEMYPIGEQVLTGTAPSINGLSPRIDSLMSQITSTSLQGFALGASALMDYNLIDGVGMSRKLLDSGAGENDPKVLLVAGSLDGAGKVAMGMVKLRDAWNEKLAKEEIKLEVIEGAGHLPMVDETHKWWEVVGSWLERV